jgi:hypothetical protein
MGDIIMSDLLKEAIADAKAVRETALANAKMALEEAFTPHLKSMLSAKLAEEDLEEDEDFQEGMHDDEDEEEETDEGMYGKPRREDDDDEENPDEGMHDDPRREDDDDEEEVDESEIVEIDGVKYAPIVSEEDEEGDDDEEEVDESEELDLEAVIRELEEELNESDPGEEEESVNEEELTEGPDEEEKVDEEVVNEEEDEEEDLEEQSTSSGIGKGTGVKQASASDEEDPGKGKTHEQVEKLQGELNEYKEAVTFLRDKLHEVNILNAKLLYTNKLFKEFVLSNDQKLKIVETFDRAQTTREIKLVYSTLAESYKDNGGERKEVVKESYASKKSGGTAPKTKIITEESQVADRFRKLAGLKS